MMKKMQVTSDGEEGGYRSSLLFLLLLLLVFLKEMRIGREAGFL